jgi:hypothetical protein
MELIESAGFLDLIYRLEFRREHRFLQTLSLSVIRRNEDAPTKLHPLARANINRWTTERN